MILLIDDDKTSRTVYRIVLERNRISVVEAAGIDDARTAIRSHDFETIVTDWSMPESSGLDVLRMVRQNERHGHVPVVIVTGHAMHDDEKRFLRMGFDAYISKPVDLDVLVDTVRSLMAS